MKELLRRGGLKLKFIGLMVLAILLTVTIVSSSIIVLMKSSLQTKALEVATTLVERISEYSLHALLERTYENELNLIENIKEVQKSNIEGLVDVSIFARVKADSSFNFEYIAGFDRYKKGELLVDKKLLQKLQTPILGETAYYDSEIIIENKEVQTYLFVLPISYIFKGEKIYLGVTTLHYDKSSINGIVKQVIIVAVLITLFFLSMTIVILYYAGLLLTNPILSIAEAATKVSKGELDIKLDISTNDEIEVLSNKFNNMVKGLREHSKMQKFVSGLTMDMIHNNNDDEKQLELGGEYKDMTFLFSDIRGFTAMSETKKPDEVVEIINFYLNIQSNIIKLYGGDIDKFIGDEVMASFYGENSVDRSIEAAIDIQKTLKEKNIDRENQGLSKCLVGIGINHGEVIVGNIGSNDRMDYTSIGSTVNHAARLCAHAKAEEILISENTVKLTKKSFRTQKLASIKVKGIAKEIEVQSIYF